MELQQQEHWSKRDRARRKVASSYRGCYKADIKTYIAVDLNTNQVMFITCVT